jgi:hypothetical protein
VRTTIIETAVAVLGKDLLDYSVEARDLMTPSAVLNHLDLVTHPGFQPMRAIGSRSSRTRVLHESAPKGWWEEWREAVHHKVPVGYMMARAALAPHTWTVARQTLQPIGVDQWGYELALKYSIRDDAPRRSAMALRLLVSQVAREQHLGSHETADLRGGELWSHAT